MGRQLHALRVEARRQVTRVGAAAGAVGQQHWREVAGGDRATVASPRARGRALARTRGHGPSWAASKRATFS
jgi:hypothetical protein